MKKHSNVYPLHGNILVIPGDKIRKRGDILLPDQAAEVTYVSEVIAVGDGAYQNGTLLPMKVKVGDKVLHKSYGVTEVEYEAEKYFIIEDRNVLAIIKEDK